MTDLQTKLQELRELVESKKVDCPVCNGRGWRVDFESNEYHTVASNSPCLACQSGQIPDPAYAALLEVMRFPCSDRGETLCPIDLGVSKVHKPCKNTGYITRSWEGMPEGALAGALYRAVRKIHLGGYSSLATYDFGEVWWNLIRGDIATDLEVVELVIKMAEEAK